MVSVSKPLTKYRWDIQKVFKEFGRLETRQHGVYPAISVQIRWPSIFYILPYYIHRSSSEAHSYQYHSKKKSILQLGAWYNMPLPYPHPMPEIPTQFQPILCGQLEGILKTHCRESKQRREDMGVWVLIMMILLEDSSYKYSLINLVIDMSDTNDQWFWHWHLCWH